MKIINDCRTHVRRAQIVKDYEVTPEARFIAPGFQTCCTKSRQKLSGIVTIFRAICRKDKEEWKIICGEGGAQDFRALLETKRKVDWPSLVTPFSSDVDGSSPPSRTKTTEGETHAFDDISRPDWVHELTIICSILFFALSPKSEQQRPNSPLFKIFLDMCQGTFPRNYIGSINTIAHAIVTTRGITTVSELIESLEENSGKKFKKPTFNRIESVRNEHPPLNLNFPWVLC